MLQGHGYITQIVLRKSFKYVEQIVRHCDSVLCAVKLYLCQQGVYFMVSN